MTDTTVRFPNLNNSNYAEWSVWMEAILVQQGLWSIVEIPISGVDTDGGVKTVSMIAAELESVMKRRDAMILRVDDAGFATSLALRQHFLTAKKGAGQSMQAWIGHIQGLAFHMEQSGVEVNDQDKILELTMGLPPSYDPVIINFNVTPSELLTLNNVIVRLLNEEVCQSSDSNGEADTAAATVGCDSDFEDDVAF
ncbi:hypothetical protein K443DRAFT_653599 [Laccaria amethystina LaAM-08-1]|uniref:DUF4219 domain-containing protein n=1 Tax=Laccaria amethystina LaAM-08-1 TaxID=1095629 RepID=A0A0C9Y086_9AGAR|nr:hypothetical protein K443DRAFT_653599 [Laccaria amethystina LaAM-08-1]